MHDYLKKILANKAQEVANLKKQITANTNHPIQQVLAGRYTRAPIKSLQAALSRSTINVVAEIKRRSPSKGELATIENPVKLAKQYQQAGAAAISVLTDHFAFGGSLNDLTAVAHALSHSPCAILRKDFIIDTIQIAEAIASGADAILLIVAATQNNTADLLKTAHQLGIDALVEVHNQQELEYALSIGAKIIGVNNRDLNTFEVNIHNALYLKPHIPNSIISVAESGIYNLDIATRYQKAGYNALLMGEALVKAENPQQLIRKICVGRHV